jgi:predicted enzyme related to lactoylglutathione lyase
MSHLPGKFTWFEHLSPEPAKAQQFYQSLFGWEAQAMTIDGRPYVRILNARETIGGFAGAAAGTPARWSSELSVDPVGAPLSLWRSRTGDRPDAQQVAVGDWVRNEMLTPMGMPCVRVEDADAIAARIAPLGGRLLTPPETIVGVGRFGALIDPLGASLGFICPQVI